MLHDTQRAIAPALHELLSTVSALRNDILAESEELYHSWHPRIGRHAFVPGAPIRPPTWRCDVAICGRCRHRSCPGDCRRLAAASRGSSPRSTRWSPRSALYARQRARTCRITPTNSGCLRVPAPLRRQPTPFLVALPGRVRRASWSRSPRKQGWSRCAYGPCCNRASSVCGLTVHTMKSSNVWTAMLANLRDAEHAVGRAEPVRVLMDLGGPKVRTVRPRKGRKERFGLGDPLLLAHHVKRQNAREPGHCGLYAAGDFGAAAAGCACVD